MPRPESSSDPEQSAAESSQRRDSEDRDSECSEKETSRLGQCEQSIAEPPPLDIPERPYPDGLVRLLSHVLPDSFEVNRALENLRLMIERTVWREMDWLAREIGAKLEASEAKSEARQAKFAAKSEARSAANEAGLASLESEFKMIRWLLGLNIAMLVAILVLLLTR